MASPCAPKALAGKTRALASSRPSLKETMNERLKTTDLTGGEPGQGGAERLIHGLRRAGAGLLHSAPTGVLVGVVAAVTVFVRWLTLEPIEIGGDALAKWEFVRQWSYANDFSGIKWTHHMARLGINVPLYFVQKILGTQPSVYYVLPVAAATAQSVFSFLVARRLAGTLAGVVAVLLLLELDPMERAGSQLVPGVFSGAYVMAALYCALRASETSGSLGRRRAWIVTGAFALFAGWLTKESNLFFVPGVAWLVYRRDRDWRDLLWLGGALGVLFLGETLFFAIGTEHHWSRFDLVAGSHGGWSGKSGSGARELNGRLRSFWDLLRRFEMTGPSWRSTLTAFTVAGLGLFAYAKDRRAVGVVLAGVSFLFCTTFLLKRLNPIAVWIGFNERYFDDGAAVIMVVIGCFSGASVRSMLGRTGRLKPWVHRGARYSGVLAVLAMGFYGFLQYQDATSALKNHPVRQLSRASDVVNDAFERRLPIVTHDRHRQRKPLWFAYSVLLDEAHVVQPDGTLPSYTAFLKKAGNITFLHRDPKISPAAVREAMRSGCAVELDQRARFIKNWPSKKLPEHCQPLTRTP